MGSNSLKCLSQIAAYLKIPAGKITLNEEQIPVRVLNKTSIGGYFEIILQLLTEAGLYFANYTALEQAGIRQWVEYGVIYGLQAESGESTVLKELNAVLATKTYLVAHKLTIADVFLYFVVQNHMTTLGSLDKERYINVSRWYDNLQQDSLLIHQSHKLVDFSTLYLATTVPDFPTDNLIKEARQIE